MKYWTFNVILIILGRRGGSMEEGMVAQFREACQTVVLQSLVQIWRLPSPQLTSNLLGGCHHGWHLPHGLTSVRGNRGENYKK
jgi:hypothetical protein